jgi:homoserine kinase
MPYYLFKISPSDKLDLVKDLELLEVFDAFRSAKIEAKKLRAQQSGAGPSFKVMFADNQLSAEEQLLEKRDKPVLMEHER